MERMSRREESDQRSRSNEEQQPLPEEEADEVGFEPRITTSFDPFIFESVDLRGVPRNEKIKRYAAGEQTMILVSESNVIYRRRLKKESEFVAHELPDPRGDNLMNLLKAKEKQASVRAVYLDPRGAHCIISTESQQHCYFNYKDSKPRALLKIKGLNIKCLGFYNPAGDNSTGEIVLVSDNGVVSLYRIDIRDELVEAFSASVAQLPTTSDVLSVEIYRLLQNPEAGGKSLITLFTTNSSIFCITGPDDLLHHWRRFEDRSERIKEYQMPRGYNSMGSTCYNKYDKRPTAYLWTNGNQLLCFRIPEKHEKITDGWMAASEPYKYCKREDLPDRIGYGSLPEIPLAVALTDHHYFLLFQECLTIVNRVSQKLVKSQDLKGGSVVDLYLDRNNVLLWVTTQANLYRLNLRREDTEVWKLLVEKKRFREAYEVSKNTQENLDYVAGIYADNLFAKKDYLQAASLYADASRSFEETFIKFMMVDSDAARQGLELYIRIWLKKLLPEEVSPRSTLLAWLVELLVYKLNNLEREMRNAAGEAIKQLRSRITETERELESLLVANLEVLDENLIYSIMQSHGRTNNLVRFAQLKNNFEMIILHHINQQDFRTAINNLKKIQDKKVVEVVYKYSHIFFREVMEDTVELLLKIIQDFKPVKLVGGLMNTPPEKRQLGIELLKYCILELKSREKSIHNILIFFYSTVVKKDKEREEFLEFLRKNRLNFDVEFALRVFKRSHLYEAQIQVYGMMELYSEAVNLALENGKFALAKTYANLPEYDDIKKKLWIEIAKNLLLQGKNVSEVISLTQECQVLKIEDLLPFFNEKIKIADFKDEICNSLKSYSDGIERLRQQMNKYASNSERLKSELNLSRSRYVQLPTNSVCLVCEQSLFAEEYFVFPCLHGFHSDCLLLSTRKQPITNNEKMEALRIIGGQMEQLKMKINQRNRRSLPVRTSTSNFSLGGMFGNILGGTTDKQKEEEMQQWSLTEDEQLLREKKQKFDRVLADECPWCGPSLAQTIMMPFANEVERESWRV